MEENMIMIKDPKIVCFNFYLPKDVDQNLQQEIKFIKRINEFLAETKIKNEIEQLLLNINMETVLMKTENSKTNEPHKFVLKFLQR